MMAESWAEGERSTAFQDPILSQLQLLLGSDVFASLEPQHAGKLR